MTATHPTLDDLTPVQLARWRFTQHANRCLRMAAGRLDCDRCSDLGDRIEIEAGRQFGWPADPDSTTG